MIMNRAAVAKMCKTLQLGVYPYKMNNAKLATWGIHVVCAFMVFTAL